MKTKEEKKSALLKALLNTYPARFLLQLFPRRFHPSTDANCPASSLSLGPLKRRYYAARTPLELTNLREYLLVLEVPAGGGIVSVKWIAAKEESPRGAASAGS